MLVALLPFVLAAPKSLPKRGIDTSKHCGDEDRIDIEQYALYINASGKNQDREGKGCGQVQSLDGTKTTWEIDWRADGSVKAFTYLGLSKGLNKQLNSIKDIQATWHYEYKDGDSGQQGHKKDTFVTIPWILTTASVPGGAIANEIRIYLSNIFMYLSLGHPLLRTSRLVPTTPIGKNLYQGQKEDGSVVFSFVTNVASSDYDYTLRTEFDGDLNWFLKYLFNNQGLAGDQYLTALEASSEASWWFCYPENN
ncbi:hypothetical protein MPER_08718 [Moniliophthora perniciosa FA553]|nr:hypothetical protein MPER_08718 [Moniliophthora perniciosa FA553]